ncbi:MAG TPA: glycosyltransferase family 2 protein [Steroidobacteraceae bacterium]|nr:glycosyltransferase family 2 protein [Steroidobacteraceae bacterium]
MSTGATQRSAEGTLAPKVTMGMPVYNGEQFVEAALRSVLAQTFADFEVLISDNASTDRTGEICRDYAARDARIRYTRNEVNLGFCRNQNSVYQRARGAYFLLTHHDDIRSPDYLERTVPVLDADPTVVVCYTQTRDIDEHDQPLPRRDPLLRFDSRDLRERFRDVIRMDHICEPDFGLTRTDVLRTTCLHGDYADSDRVLLAELALHGRFHRIPEYLFFRRAHTGQSTSVAPDRQSRTVWFDPQKYQGKLLFPHFREFREYLAAVARAPIRIADRLWCMGEMVRWLGTNRRRLQSDLDHAGRQLLRPLYYALLGRSR